MPRLRHIIHELEASGGLIAGRARTLVSAGRKVGMFTTEGKGRRVEVGAGDAVSALLLALHVDVASEAVEVAESLRGLPLFSVEAFDVEGHRGGSRAAAFYATAPADDRPPRLDTLDAAATLGAALLALYDDQGGEWIAHHFHPADRLELTRNRTATTVDLRLSDYGGERWWRLRFMAPEHETDLDAAPMVTTRTIRGPLLDALARLVEAGE